jgi:predicted RNase H-like HicB family nuclease
MPRRALEEYLAMQYPLQIIADPDGGYVAIFPDLPGCMTQAETLGEIPAAAEDARRSWMTAVYEDGEEIPPPSYPEEYSGKFVARLPRALHHQLAEEADRQGVSLNQHVVALLSRGDVQARLERRLHDVEERLSSRLDVIAEHVERLRFPITHAPFTSDQRVTTFGRGVKSTKGRQAYRDSVAP